MKLMCMQICRLALKGGKIMIINDAVKGVNEKKIAGAWDKADEILASQHANQWRVELPILRGDTPTFMGISFGIKCRRSEGNRRRGPGNSFRGSHSTFTDHLSAAYMRKTGT